MHNPHTSIIGYDEPTTKSYTTSIVEFGELDRLLVEDMKGAFARRARGSREKIRTKRFLRVSKDVPWGMVKYVPGMSILSSYGKRAPMDSRMIPMLWEGMLPGESWPTPWRLSLWMAVPDVAMTPLDALAMDTPRLMLETQERLARDLEAALFLAEEGLPTPDNGGNDLTFAEAAQAGTLPTWIADARMQLELLERWILRLTGV